MFLLLISKLFLSISDSESEEEIDYLLNAMTLLPTTLELEKS